LVIDNNFLSQFEGFEEWRTKAQETAENQQPTAPAFTNQTETPDEVMRVYEDFDSITCRPRAVILKCPRRVLSISPALPR
jgi:hypothetical protein